MSEGLRFIEGRDVRAIPAPGGTHLHIEIAEDRCIPYARLRRLFPLSSTAAHLSVQQADGKEVAIVRDLAEVDDASRRAIDAELDRRYFTPHITRILDLEMEAGMWRWRVETQRGELEFFVRNWRDSAHEITPNRWQIHSVDGGRIEIENTEELDDKSKKRLEQLL